MLYRITISRAGSVIDTVVVEAQNALEAIDQVEAPLEKFPVVVSIRYGELTTIEWSGFEFEARKLDMVNGDQSPHLSIDAS